MGFSLRGQADAEELRIERELEKARGGGSSRIIF